MKRSPDFADGYTMEWHSRAAALPADLWAECFRPPMEGRWWFEALERSGLEDQFTFFYGLVRDEIGDPAGIVPAFLMDVPVAEMTPPNLLGLLRLAGRVAPSLLRQRTLFVGSPCIETGSISIAGWADRRAALLAAQHALEQKVRETGAELLIWKDFSDEWAADFEWLASQRRLFRVATLPGATAPLPPSSRREDYFAALKGSRRHNLKKKLRRSHARAAFEVQVVAQPDAPMLDEIFSLFWQTYEKSKTKFERLNPRFFAEMAAAPPAFFVTLREPAGGKLVAFMLCFDLGERMVNKFVGLDYSQPKETMLYFRLWEGVLDVALARGFTAVSSGQLAYAFKIETGHALEPLHNFCRHRNPVLHHVFKMVARTITWTSLDEGLAPIVKAHPELTASPREPRRGWLSALRLPRARPSGPTRKNVEAPAEDRRTP